MVIVRAAASRSKESCFPQRAWGHGKDLSEPVGHLNQTQDSLLFMSVVNQTQDRPQQINPKQALSNYQIDLAELCLFLVNLSTDDPIPTS